MRGLIGCFAAPQSTTNEPFRAGSGATPVNPTSSIDTVSCPTLRRAKNMIRSKWSPFGFNAVIGSHTSRKPSGSVAASVRFTGTRASASPAID